MNSSDATDFSSRARQVAAFIALVAGATLVLRIVLSISETGSISAALLFLSQFFTILTNTLVFALFAAIAFGVQVQARLIMALTIAIVGVGIVYHVALAHLLDLSGLALLADHGVHTVVPALTLIWWLWFAPKERFRPMAIPVWIAWPLIYCIYIMIRASGSGFYPYPFLNVTELGVGLVARNIVILSLAFVAIGLLLTALHDLLRRWLSPTG